MKKWLINGLGIVLALCMVFGGMVLLDHLLIEKHKRYLSASGGLDATGLSLEVSEQNSERPILTKEELKQVLSAMTGEEVPHEPLEGQLSMEQAMELGKAWIREFYLEGLGLSDAGEEKYQRMDARLCGKQGEDSNILYSYWTVSLVSQEIYAELVMNAVTGQVLDARLTFNRVSKEQDTSYECSTVFSDEIVWQLLERYIASFGLEEENAAVLVDQNGFYQSIDEGELYVLARNRSRLLSYKTDVFVQYTDVFGVEESEEGSFLRLSITVKKP